APVLPPGSPSACSRDLCDRSPPSVAGPRGAAHITALFRNAGLLVADAGKGGDPFADRLLRRQAKAQAQARSRRLAVASPFRAWVERNPGIERRLNEFPDVDLVRQFHPQEDAAFWSPRLDSSAELALQRFDHRVEFFFERPAQFADVIGKILREILGD